MKEWNKLVWRSYLDKLGDCIPNLLILDKTTMHINTNVINTIEKYDTEIKFIPSGMTRILQPLDVVINKPFKEYIRRFYLDYSTSIHLDNVKIRYNTILNWISEIWWDDSLITSSMIKYSFRTTGIANKFDKSEDSLFKGFQRLREEVAIEKDKDLKNAEIDDEMLANESSYSDE